MAYRVTSAIVGTLIIFLTAGLLLTPEALIGTVRAVDVEVEIGPFEKDGEFYEGMEVVVIYEDEEYEGEVDKKGYALIELPSTALEEDVDIEVKWEGEKFEGSLEMPDEHGDRVDPPETILAELPSLKESGGDSDSGGVSTALIAAIAIVVIIIVLMLILLLRKKKKPEEKKEYAEPPTERPMDVEKETPHDDIGLHGHMPPQPEIPRGKMPQQQQRTKSPPEVPKGKMPQGPPPGKMPSGPPPGKMPAQAPPPAEEKKEASPPPAMETASPPPAAAVVSQEKKEVKGEGVRMEPAVGAVVCNVCLGYVKPGLNLVVCGCNKKFHPSCAMRVGECPSCGRDFSSELDKYSEEELQGPAAKKTAEEEVVEELEKKKEEKKGEEPQEKDAGLQAYLNMMETALETGDFKEVKGLTEEAEAFTALAKRVEAEQKAEELRDIDAYMIMLKQALADGLISTGEEMLLKQVREEMAISDDEHEMLMAKAKYELSKK